MQAVLDRAGRLSKFVWSAWAGVVGLSLLTALWQMGHETYGDFILPAPLATFTKIHEILSDPSAWELTLKTTQSALKGFFLATLIGGITGITAGYSLATLRVMRPVLTVILGVPPIAWVVLAMIWFGATDGTVVTSVIVASMPIIFAGAAEGIATRDRGLDHMAQAFGAGPIAQFYNIGMRHLTAHFFPALILAIGMAFKVAVMAELLSNTEGIGGALAHARSNLDMTGALAWILVAVLALFAIEYALIHPIRSELERWREAAQPWGVKR